MNSKEYKNGLRRSINERKVNLEKVKSLFHRAEAGSDIWKKSGKLYRDILVSIREMEKQLN